MKRRKRESTQSRRNRGAEGSGNSNYARKKAWLARQIEPCPWGFHIAEPKPWKIKKAA